MMCKAQNSGNELVCVHLFKSMCLTMPIFLYAVEAVQPNKSTIRMFNAWLIELSSEYLAAQVQRISNTQDLSLTYLALMMRYAAGDLFFYKEICNMFCLR